MGLLDKAITSESQGSAASRDIKTVIVDFQRQNVLFHCVVLQFNNDRQQRLADIAAMTAPHGAVCCSLSRKNGLVLLPGKLDMELFSHQLSKSTCSTVLCQFSANVPSVAIETLSPYL